MNTLHPLNIWSGSEEEIGRKMSHFYEAPFVLDGVEFASVEAVFAWLLVPEETRDSVRMLSDRAAKKAIPRKDRRPESINYHGRQIQVESDDFLEIIYRANVAKLEAHPELAREFVATSPRTITHILPHHSNPQDNPVFNSLMVRLRDEFARRLGA